MPIKGLIAVERSMALMLRAQLNAQIDAVWAAWAAYDATDTDLPIGGCPKVYPMHVYVGYRREIPEYPAVSVVGIESVVEEDAMGQGPQGWQSLAHTLEIAWIFQSDDVHVLDQQVKRYGIAVWEAVMLNGNLDGSLVGTALTHLEKSGISEVYKHERTQQLMQAGAWRVVVRLDETA